MGLCEDNGKYNGNYRDHRDYVGFTLGLYQGIYRGYIGITEKKMETIIMDYMGNILGYILGLYKDIGD